MLVANLVIAAQAEKLRLLKEADLERAVIVQSSAFQGDPLWIHLFPDPARRAKKLSEFFRVFLKIYIRDRAAYGVGEPIQGVAVWIPPSQGGMDYSGFVGFDLAKLVFNGFFFPFLKALKVFRRFEALQKKYAPEPHYYLSTVAVLPESQGKGFASSLVLPFLREAEEKSLGVYTETLTPANVGFYSHFGFVCVEKSVVPKTGLSIYALYRSPRKLT
jgi:ribosomal protein S18 acetylase RimI-like enzyme